MLWSVLETRYQLSYATLRRYILQPSFDVMVHLAVHLPDEALLRGPIQYGWMYPIERRLGTFKGYVRNIARPESSIAEAYIATEALTFCSKYIEIADQLSKEVVKTILGSMFSIILFELQGRVNKRRNLQIWTKWFGMR